MYVDPEETESMKTTEKDDVKEATEALKGLLGLSTPSPTATAPEAAPVQPAPTQQQQQQQDSGKKKNKRKKKKKTTNNDDNDTPARTPPKPKGKKEGKKQQKNPKAKGPKNENENYAWSAFQSSPDASKLPIPAFSPDPPQEKQREVQTAATTPLCIPATPEDQTPSVKTDKSEEATKPSDYSPSSTPSLANPSDVEQFAGESTGVNLAALAAEKRSTNHARPPPPPSFSNFPPPQQYYPPNMPPPNPYAAPPGYVTIQVQLPMVLPPDRTIVVQSPTGFPISVRVPEAFMPGTIIPVNVPTGPPPPMTMYNYPPPH